MSGLVLVRFVYSKCFPYFIRTGCMTTEGKSGVFAAMSFSDQIPLDSKKE